MQPSNARTLRIPLIAAIVLFTLQSAASAQTPPPAIALTPPQSASSVPPESAKDRARFQDAVALYDAGRYAEAFKIFADLSDSDAAAARNAGLMLRTGQGVPRDAERAKRMLEWAGLAGLATAQADLGEMLLNGEGNGVPDAKAALPWLKLAAVAHHSIAQYHLGKLYETGTAVPRDLEEAKRLYREAAANGVKEAADRLTALEGPNLRGFRPYQPGSGGGR